MASFSNQSDRNNANANSNDNNNREVDKSGRAALALSENNAIRLPPVSTSSSDEDDYDKTTDEENDIFPTAYASASLNVPWQDDANTTPSNRDHPDESDAIAKMMFDMWGNKERAHQYPGEHTSKALTKNIEKLVAKELFEMKKDTRDAILEELHGVKSRAVPESPQLIESALVAFEDELQTLNYKEKVTDINGKSHPLDQAHLRATNNLQSKYVTSPEFRIRFLRTEFFTVKKAVIRYCKNLNYIWDLFGDTALVRQIYLTDLSKKELKYLKGGQIQCLMARDKMGRRILNIFGTYDISIRDRMRAEAYLNFAAMADDKSSQIYGIVHVAFFSDTVNCVIRFDQDERFIIKKFVSAAPIRCTSLHYCMPDETIFDFFKTIGLSLVSPEMRTCTRVHSGSPMESIYALCQFGIPVDAIPLSVTGTVKSKFCEKFIKMRTAIEQYQKRRCHILGVDYVTKEMEEYLNASPSALLGFPPSCPGTDCPSLDCIVFGDRSFYKHPGNIVFRDYLKVKRDAEEQRREEERKLDKRENIKSQRKRLFFGEFMNEILDETSKRYKFAYYDKDVGWYAHITADTAENRQELRKRISQLVRDERKRERGMHATFTASSISSSSSSSIGIGDNEDSQSVGGGDVDTSSTLSVSSYIGVDAKRFKPNIGCGVNGCG